MTPTQQDHVFRVGDRVRFPNDHQEYPDMVGTVTLVDGFSTFGRTALNIRLDDVGVWADELVPEEKR